MQHSGHGRSTTGWQTLFLETFVSALNHSFWTSLSKCQNCRKMYHSQTNLLMTGRWSNVFVSIVCIEQTKLPKANNVKFPFLHRQTNHTYILFGQTDCIEIFGNDVLYQILMPIVPMNLPVVIVFFCIFKDTHLYIQ